VLRVRQPSEAPISNFPEGKDGATEESQHSAQVFLAEAKLREFMERKSSAIPVKAMSWEDVQVYEGLSPGCLLKVRALLKRYSSIWSNGGRLPKPLKGGEYSIKLKPGAKPVVCGEERYTPARAAYLTKWAKAALESGLYERAGNSPYANRMHLTIKDGPPGSEREQFDVREVEDLVNLNDCTMKEAPNVPILNHQVERISGRKLFYKFDGAHASSQVVLDDGQDAHWKDQADPDG